MFGRGTAPRGTRRETARRQEAPPPSIAALWPPAGASRGFSLARSGCNPEALEVL